MPSEAGCVMSARSVRRVFRARLADPAAGAMAKWPRAGDARDVAIGRLWDKENKRMSMFKPRKELAWGGRKLILETGRSPVRPMAPCSRPTAKPVLCTVVGAKSAKPGSDFFPLTVNYQEKAFAAGKIPGGFFKREGRPTEKETLVSPPDRPPDPPAVPRRLPQRDPGRPTVLSHDLENDPDIVAMIAASAALTISGIPFMGPIGAARVGYKDGEYHAEPDRRPDAEDSQLDLVVAGTDEGVLMVESEAKELSEEVMLGAVMFGHDGIPAGDQGDHRTGRKCRQGALALPTPRDGCRRSCRS